MTASSRRSPRGSALMVVLWALAILTTAVFGWAQWIQRDLAVRGIATRQVEARAMAHSGVAVALHPKVNKQTPMLQQEVMSGAGYRARIISEGGKLNLNWLLMSGEAPRIVMFKQWLESRGLNFQERERLTDCLLDYMDPDNLRRLNGAEDEGDYHPANRALQNLDELLAVKGMEPLIQAGGDWKDELTLHSSGPIDLLSAKPQILRLVPGMSDARIQRLLQLRQGPDKLEGTMDDPIYQNLNVLLQQLGFGPRDMQSVGQYCMVNDPVVRVLSEGISGNVHRQVEVVARKGTLTPLILLWKE